MLDERALVLNRSWTPISTTSVRRAIVLVVRGAAGVVHPETYQVAGWDDWVRRGPADRPVVRGLRRRGAGARGHRAPTLRRLSRPGASRSRGATSIGATTIACQYCGARPGLEDLTIDHVVPRSRGGGSTWENCVTACRPCNARKANRFAHELDLFLGRTPAAPRWPGGLDPASVLARPAWHKFLPASSLAVGA